MSIARQVTSATANDRLVVMRTHRFIIGAVVLGLLTTAACGSKEEGAAREYSLHGQILAVTPDAKEANIKHDEIKGFMPAMTMPYKAREPEFKGLAPGDLISATLVVLSNDAYLKGVKKTGEAPLEKAPEEKPAASSGFELLKQGAAIPSTSFVDQNGQKKELPRDFLGKTVALTFSYTRCPMPTFCPLMDRNFATMQEELKGNAGLNAHLVTVSIDPTFDTPAVLKKHAERLKADPQLWTFLTGDRDEIDKFASRFGLSLVRSVTDQSDITHTLRTVIIDRQGNLVKTLTGNEWKPGDVVADMQALVAAD
jgi:protein SCO1/2